MPLLTGLHIRFLVDVRIMMTLLDTETPAPLGTDINNKEHAIGAIMEDGTTYVNEELIHDLQISTEYLENEKSYQTEEINRRTALFKSTITTKSYRQNRDLGR
jgi:hypothetical protein